MNDKFTVPVDVVAVPGATTAVKVGEDRGGPYGVNGPYTAETVLYTLDAMLLAEYDVTLAL